MGITVEQKSDEKDFGTDESSFLVPMGYFSVVKSDHETIKYLKSSGFASCIGLVLHSEDATLLAHYQSANWNGKGIKKTAEEFGKAGILDFSKYEGFLFLGSQRNEAITNFGTSGRRGSVGSSSAPKVSSVHGDSTTQLQSIASSGDGLKKVKEHMTKLGVKFSIDEFALGFKSAAVSIKDGEIRLFNDTPVGKVTGKNNLFPAVGSALLNTQPG